MTAAGYVPGYRPPLTTPGYVRPPAASGGARLRRVGGMATDRGPAPRTPAQQPSDPALHARRASSFGAEAAAYAEHRPDYPRDGVRWALEPVLSSQDAGADQDTALDILDLGAGTGKLTAVLTAL